MSSVIVTARSDPSFPQFHHVTIVFEKDGVEIIERKKKDPIDNFITDFNS